MSKKVTDTIRSEEMFSSYNNFPISMVFFFFLILCINIPYNKFSHQRLLWNFCGSFLGFIWNEKLPPHNFFVIFVFVFGLKLFQRIDFSFQIYAIIIKWLNFTLSQLQPLIIWYPLKKTDFEHVLPLFLIHYLCTFVCKPCTRFRCYCCLWEEKT